MSCRQSLPKVLFPLLLLTIVAVSSVSSGGRSRNGLHPKKGQGHRMVNLTTPEQKLALEHAILKLLGFPDKPKTVTGRAPLVKRSAPKFLMNVYKNTLNDGFRPNQNKTNVTSEFDMSKRELLTIDQSDVIITFTAHQPHHGAGGKPDRVKRMWFDVSTIPDDAEMTSAELRLYRGPDASNKKNEGAFAITVYRVSRVKGAERELIFVDSVNTTAGHRGWIILNVTEALRYWMTNATNNRGIYLSANPVDRLDQHTRPENIGIVGFKGDVELQPFMAGFFKSDGLIQARSSHLVLQTLEWESERRRRSAESVAANSSRHSDPFQTDGKVPNPCNVRNLYVSFKDLHWQDWIIAPEGYDAYFCDGECDFPLNARNNVTKHAIVQSLVHHLHPDRVPKPCCTPTQLSPISVLYFLDDSNVILKKFKNMVVQGCGCR